MLKKYRNSFIPAAALVCFGVEQTNASLVTPKGIKGENNSNSYEINLANETTNPRGVHRSKNDSNSNTLYNRKQRLTIEQVRITPPEPDNIDDIKKKDNLESKSQKLIIKTKDKEITPKKAISYTKPKIKRLLDRMKSSNIDTYTYIVKERDTLTSIATEFGVSIRRILSLNGLKPQSQVKIGQRLKLPKNSLKIAKKKYTKRFHIVKRGESLSLIAKKYNVDMKKLLAFNNLSSQEHIKIGQKLYFYPKYSSKHRDTTVRNSIKITKRPQSFTKSIKIAKKTKRRLHRKIRKQVLKVTATAYTSHKNQTDSTPFLAAWNNKIRPGMKIIAVSRDLIYKYGLTNGVKVRIKGLPGIYTVRDKMNKRYKERIDIYMGMNKKKALKWGKRQITLLVVN